MSLKAESRNNANQTAGDHLLAVDSMRAIAALSVLAFHASVRAVLSEDSLLGQLAHRLNVGVTIFFLISGFVLYRPFVKARLSGKKPLAIGSYLKRRVLRVVPAYWVALTVVAVVLALPNFFNDGNFLTFYGFGQIYNSETYSGGLGVAWTLCVEVTFYLFLPLFSLLVARIPASKGRKGLVQREWFAVGGLFLASLIYKLWVLKTMNIGSGATLPYLKSLPFFLDQFALGMALAVFSVSHKATPQGSTQKLSLSRFSGFAWVAAAAIFFVVATQLGIRARTVLTPDQYLARHLLFAAVAFLLLLPAVVKTRSSGLVLKLLHSRMLIAIGSVSYGIYLYHSFINQLLFQEGLYARGPSGYLVWISLSFVGALVLAVLSYRLIEKPAMALARGRSLRQTMADLKGKKQLTKEAPSGPQHRAKDHAYSGNKGVVAAE